MGGGGGGGGVAGWRGGSSEGISKWGDGVGVIKGSFQNILKQGVGKGKSCSWGGGGVESVTTPAPSENFNHTQNCLK